MLPEVVLRKHPLCAGCGAKFYVLKIPWRKVRYPFYLRDKETEAQSDKELALDQTANQGHFWLGTQAVMA